MPDPTPLEPIVDADEFTPIPGLDEAPLADPMPMIVVPDDEE